MLPLDEFGTTYSRTSKLPFDKIGDEYDKQIFELFSKGKEMFFQAIEFDYPEIYKFLIENCSDLYLVENRSVTSSEYIYFWAMATLDGYIKSSIPFGYRINNVSISEKAFYNAIPDILKPFYHAINGFDIDDNPYANIEYSGFLRTMDNWPPIDRVFGGVNLRKSIVSYISANFPESNFRVICYGLEDDALVVDVRNKYPGLFQVKIDPVSFKLLDNPSKYITDIFFSNFPEAQRG